MTATIVSHTHRVQIEPQDHAEKMDTADALAHFRTTGVFHVPGQLWERAAEQEPAATGRIAVIAWRLSARAIRLDLPGPSAVNLSAFRSGVIRPMEEAA